MNTTALEIKLNAIVVIRNIIQNMGQIFYEYVDDVANLFIEELILDPSTKVRKESAKCLRACIECCKENPDHQKQLFLMSYLKTVVDLDKRIDKQEFMKLNVILKELSKQLGLFAHFKDLKMTIFTFEDAKLLIDKLQQIA
jgi:hypothetical protein